MAFAFLADSSRPTHSRVSRSSRATQSSTSKTLVQPLELEPSVDTPVEWIVPYERNHYFTGRISQLTSVHRKFSQTSKDHHRIAIYGLGGVGKTQFALEYLYRFRNDYDYCFWVSGVERTALVSELGLVAKILNFTPSRQNLTHTEVASELLRWLPQVSRWLLIIDNLDDMKVLQDLVPSGTATGHVLITTRSANLRGLPAYTFEVPVLSPKEAAELLVRRAMPDSPECDVSEDIWLEAKRIVEELGYLPLAIEQAAGYIQQSLHGIFGFRSIYQSNQRRILNRPVSMDYSKSVSTTWLISFKTLRNDKPDALQLLNLFAFLNPDEILVNFLHAGKEGLDEKLKYLVADPCIFDELLMSLTNFSLIQRFQQKKSIAIHRLVQVVIKDGLKSEELTRWRNTTIALCAKAFPPVQQKDILLHRQFRSQVMPCIMDPDLENSCLAADLLSRMGWYLDCEAQHGESTPLYERAIEIYRKADGEGRKDLFINMDRLGWNYMKQGRIVEATNTFQEAFSSLCRVLGEEHDHTLACQRNYGVALLKQGRVEEGMAMLKDACTKQREILGDNNPRTHATMRKLAAAYMQQNNKEDAIALLEIVYSSAMSDPRGTFHSVQCELGWAYCQKNRFADGTKLLKNARTLQTKALGDEHPDTLKSARYLACAYVLQGDIAEGTDLLEQTYIKQKEQLGLEHEETLLSMQYLATIYQDQGRSTDASALEVAEVLKKRGLKPKSWTI